MSVKIKEYDGPLFRAEEYGGSKPLEETAEQHYPSTIHYHFFTTVEREVEPYRKEGTKYTKTWVAEKPLVLLDIMDLNTRNWLLHAINANHLNTAFPVVKNKVYRFSNNTTDKIDRAVLGKICNLTTPNGRRIDGYYMARQDMVPPNSNYNAPFNRRLSKFHSEVGLCRHAFHKLRLEHIDTKKAAIGPNRKKKTRRNYNSNNNTRRNILSPNKRPKPSMLFNTPEREPAISANSFNTPPRPRGAQTKLLF